MDLKEIVNEAILTYVLCLSDGNFAKLPPENKVNLVIKLSPKLSALAKKPTSEPDKALGLFGVSPCCLPAQKEIDNAYGAVISEDMRLNLNYGSKDYFVKGIHFCYWHNKG